MKRFKKIEEIVNEFKNKFGDTFLTDNFFCKLNKGFVLNECKQNLKEMLNVADRIKEITKCIKDLSEMNNELINYKNTSNYGFSFKIRNNILILFFDISYIDVLNVTKNIDVKTKKVLSEHELEELQLKKWDKMDVLQKMDVFLNYNNELIKQQKDWINYLNEEI